MGWVRKKWAGSFQEIYDEILQSRWRSLSWMTSELSGGEGTELFPHQKKKKEWKFGFSIMDLYGKQGAFSCSDHRKSEIRTSRPDLRCGWTWLPHSETDWSKKREQYLRTFLKSKIYRQKVEDGGSREGWGCDNPIQLGLLTCDLECKLICLQTWPAAMLRGRGAKHSFSVLVSLLPQWWTRTAQINNDYRPYKTLKYTKI